MYDLAVGCSYGIGGIGDYERRTRIIGWGNDDNLFGARRARIERSSERRTNRGETKNTRRSLEKDRDENRRRREMKEWRDDGIGGRFRERVVPGVKTSVERDAWASNISREVAIRIIRRRGCRVFFRRALGFRLRALCFRGLFEG